MKTVGIIILIIGLVMTLYGGYTYVTREKVVQIGELEISADVQHTTNWQPYVGLVVMAIGGAILIFDRKKPGTT